MSLFVLDTDMLKLLEEAHPVVSKKVGSVPTSDLAVTLATVEEKLTGRYTLIRRAKKPDQLIHAYHRLTGAINLLKPLRIFEVSKPAFERYQSLNAKKLGISKMDLLIAAIVLDAAATLVTRNLSDFSKVPGLTCVDWSGE
jgi:tRNA(fMet)-specific endonuclease VapC